MRTLKPKDILVLLRLVGEPPEWIFHQLGTELGLSGSEVHQALKRAPSPDSRRGERPKNSKVQGST